MTALKLTGMLIVAATFLAGPCAAQESQEAKDRLSALRAHHEGPQASPAILAEFQPMVGHPKVKAALDLIKVDEPRTLSEQKENVGIEAPPFKEQARAQNFLQLLRHAGLTGASIKKAM